MIREMENRIGGRNIHMCFFLDRRRSMEVMIIKVIFSIW